MCLHFMYEGYLESRLRFCLPPLGAQIKVKNRFHVGFPTANPPHIHLTPIPCIQFISLVYVIAEIKFVITVAP